METLLRLVKNNFKKVVALIIILFLAFLGYYFCHKHAKKIDTTITTPVLTPDQKEKIIVDPVKHEITVITKKADGTTQTNTTYFPDRSGSIIENNDGKLNIIERTWGTELRPYLGFGYDLEASPRLHLGADVFYYKKLDLGLGIGFNPTELKDTTGNINLSYNIWDNTSLAVSYDNHHTVGFFMKVRF